MERSMKKEGRAKIRQKELETKVKRTTRGIKQVQKLNKKKIKVLKTLALEKKLAIKREEEKQIKAKAVKNKLKFLKYKAREGLQKIKGSRKDEKKAEKKEEKAQAAENTAKTALQERKRKEVKQATLELKHKNHKAAKKSEGGHRKEAGNCYSPSDGSKRDRTQG